MSFNELSSREDFSHLEQLKLLRKEIGQLLIEAKLAEVEINAWKGDDFVNSYPGDGPVDRNPNISDADRERYWAAMDDKYAPYYRLKATRVPVFAKAGNLLHEMVRAGRPERLRQWWPVDDSLPEELDFHEIGVLNLDPEQWETRDAYYDWVSFTISAIRHEDFFRGWDENPYDEKWQITAAGYGYYAAPHVGDTPEQHSLDVADLCHVSLRAVDLIIDWHDPKYSLPSSLPAMTQSDINVLLVMSKSSELIRQADLEARVDLSRKTLSPILARFRALGLTERPKGPRQGERITPAGRDFLSRLRSQGE